jgi:1-acyl-sn-glycerol-3-phosphate acyltransferase
MAVSSATLTGANTYAPRLTLTRRAVTRAAGLVFRRAFDISAEGVGHLPLEGPVLLVCNHVTNFDVIPMQLSLPRPFFPMAKSEIFEHPLSAWLYRELGAFPVRRGERDEWALDCALGLLARGEVLLMFPEGTRNRGRGLRHGKTGAARLALATGTPIVPMTVYGTHCLFRPVHRRSPVSVTVGRPFRAEPGDTPAGLTDRIMRTLARMLPPDQRGVYA